MTVYYITVNLKLIFDLTNFGIFLPNTDSDIVQQALNGDQNAFAVLLKRYRGAIYGLIYKMVQDKNETEDLVQETFIKAFSALGSFNAEYAFSTWLFKIASNNCIDFLWNVINKLFRTKVC